MTKSSVSRAVIFMVFLLFVSSTLPNKIWRANMYDVANFTDSNSPGYNHLTVNGDTGYVYVAGVNNLYKLDENLMLEVNASTGPLYIDDNWSDTYNKILEINEFDNNLVVCGGYGGSCQLRNVQNLSVLYQDNWLHVTADTVDDSTVGFVAPGYDDNPVLYVGTTKINHDIVSGRKIEIGTDTFHYYGQGTYISVQYAYHNVFHVDYVFGFSYNGFSYFVTTQNSDGSVSVGWSDYVSRIVRVCQTKAAGADERYDTYTEVTLRCSGADGIPYNLAKAAYLTRPGQTLIDSMGLDDDEDVLFVAFTKIDTVTNNKPISSDQSTLCMFRMNDIELGFTVAVRECLADTDSPSPYTLQFLQRATCGRYSVPFDPLFECSSYDVYIYANNKEGVTATAVLEYPDKQVTSLSVTTVQNHTVGFLGTSDGQIIKVHIMSSSSAFTYEEVNFGNDALVNSDVVFDSTKAHFYMMTGNTVRKVKVEECSQYTTCHDCFAARDPYCGWCTLERRCSLYANCTKSEMASRWLDPFTNNCINITSIQPEDGIPISVIHQINLNLRKLPDESDQHSYSCNYDGYFNTLADNDGQTLTCDTPPISVRPVIPAGEDHVTISLYVGSSETQVDFVVTQFHFYDCSSHMRCSDCVSSNWACNWCVYENRCTHYRDICPEDYESTIITGVNNQFNASLTIGQSFCPQLVMQDGEVLIPVNVDREIHLSTLNIFTPKIGQSGYECVLTIEGRDETVTATRYNETSVVCDMQKYNYEDEHQEINVTLTLKWNGNHVIDYRYTVTLYKCGVDRRDCSECLSAVTTRIPLLCGWCTGSNTCEVAELCVSDWWEHGITNNCPKPVINKIWPVSGPYEGGTELVINGTDFGKHMSNIMEVNVDGIPCSIITDRYLVSRGIECRTGESSAGHSGPVYVTLFANDGTISQSDKSSMKFSYWDPVIYDFTPKIGPKAGGTIITITGDHINAGRYIQADLDGLPCQIERITDVVNDTHVVCTTTSSPNTTHLATLSMSFDGSWRLASLDKTFEYTENPSVQNIVPQQSMESGGCVVNVTGAYFTSIQEPKMLITTPEEYVSEPCTVLSSHLMQCITPPVQYPSTVRTTRDTEFTVGFIMDGVEEVRQLHLQFDIVTDPKYLPFHEDNHIRAHVGIQLAINGHKLNSACTRHEVTVTIGQEDCEVVSLSDNQLSCIPPLIEPGGVNKTGNPTDNGLPEVRVEVGNIEFFIGYVRYQRDDEPRVATGIIVGVVVTFILILLILVLVVIGYRKRMSNLEKKMLNYKMEAIQMDVKGLSNPDQSQEEESHLERTMIDALPYEELSPKPRPPQYEQLDKTTVLSRYEDIQTRPQSSQYEGLQPRPQPSQYEGLQPRPQPSQYEGLQPRPQPSQ
ncbi:plexin-B-like [Glandiceps talaboti]